MTSKTPPEPNYAGNRRKKESTGTRQYKLVGRRGHLPATVAADVTSVGACEATTTATTATPASTATATPATTAATAAAVADHLGKTRINLLLSLSKDGDQVTSLLRICEKS
jgi:hypothetical protein